MRLHELSIGELARELMLSKSGLFAHFQSKENLQLAVWGAIASLRLPPGERRLGSLFEHWVEWIRDDNSAALVSS